MIRLESLLGSEHRITASMLAGRNLSPSPRQRRGVACLHIRNDSAYQSDSRANKRASRFR